MLTRIFLFVPVILLVFASIIVQQLSLPAIENLIEEIHPAVAGISHQQLQRSLKNDSEASQILIFDVRRREEYDVSHLKNAIPLNQNLSSEDFIRLHAAKLAGKKLVFYCSVGYRSSGFIEQIQQEASRLGYQSVQNLTGGIFFWYNEGLPVYKQNGLTDQVHPYDAFWGRLLLKKKLKR